MGETGCVSGAGEGCSRYGWVGKPEIRTKMHQIAMQHMKKGNRRKPSVFAGFVAGAEGLGLGCRLGRLVACVPLARTRPTTRTAGGPAGAPCCQFLPHTNEKVRHRRSDARLFWQGQKDLNPRHAVLEWMWESAPGSKRTMLLTDFSRQAQKSWCWFGAEKVADGILRNRNDIFRKHL